MKIIAILLMWAAVLGIYWKLTSREPLNVAPTPPGATLDVLLDGPDLFIDFDVPALDLLGFEHAPQNADEHSALVEAHRMLDSGMMTIPAVAARCTLTESFATVGHGYDDLCSSGSSSIDQPFSKDLVQRSNAVAASQDNGLISARWAWVCQQPDQLDNLSVHLFEIFSHLQSVSITTNGKLQAGESAIVHAQERQYTDIELRQ